MRLRLEVSTTDEEIYEGQRANAHILAALDSAGIRNVLRQLARIHPGEVYVLEQSLQMYEEFGGTVKCNSVECDLDIRTRSVIFVFAVEVEGIAPRQTMTNLPGRSEVVLWPPIRRSAGTKETAAVPAIPPGLTLVAVEPRRRPIRFR